MSKDSLLITATCNTITAQIQVKQAKMASTASASNLVPRSATVSRVTNETKIEVSLALDTHPTLAPQTINVKTGIGFLDHVSRRIAGFIIGMLVERLCGCD